jgi:hypothetical protein
MRLVAMCLVSVAALGCGGPGPPPPETKDPAVYARTIKQAVNAFVTEAKSDLATAPKQAAILLETLEVYKGQPVGDHEAIYAELTARCRELANAKGADVQKKLNDMAALAQKLPG